MRFSEYPTHIRLFYLIGVQATVTIGVFAVTFGIDRTVTALLRRRRARRNAVKETS